MAKTLYGEKIVNWNDDNVMVMTDQHGAVYYMVPADVANAMADKMRTATSEKNGLMSKNSFMVRTGYKDANLAIESGMYNDLTNNIPSGYTRYCVITYNFIPGAEHRIKQIAFPSPNETLNVNYNKMFIRYKIALGWSEWKEL